MQTRLNLICVMAVLAFALSAASYAWLAEFPVAYDERAHLSYALHIAHSGDPAPSFDELRLVEPDDPKVWSETPNYLNHPAAYYLLMAGIATLLPGPGGVFGLRLANVVLAVAAVVITLRLVWRTEWPPNARLTFMVLVVATPILPVLGGTVTNDNLAILGGVLCCAGVHQLHSERRGADAWIVSASGFAMASLAKLTAGLLCGFLCAFAVVWLVAREGWGTLRHPAAGLALGICVLALGPYLGMIAEHGSPAPLTDGQAAMLAERLDERPFWRDHRYDLLGYAQHFAASLFVYWPPAQPASTSARLLLVLPALILCVALVGLVLAWRCRDRDATARLIVCGGLALAAVLMVHFAFSYDRHLETGWLNGVYPRYYLPLLPILPAAAAFAVSRIRAPGAQAWCSIGLIVLALGYGVLNPLPAIGSS